MDHAIIVGMLIYTFGSILAGLIFAMKEKWNKGNMLLIAIIITPFVNLWVVYTCFAKPKVAPRRVTPARDRLSQRRKPSIIVHQGLPSRQEVNESENEQ